MHIVRRAVPQPLCTAAAAHKKRLVTSPFEKCGANIAIIFQLSAIIQQFLPFFLENLALPTLVESILPDFSVAKATAKGDAEAMRGRLHFQRGSVSLMEYSISLARLACESGFLPKFAA